MDYKKYRFNTKELISEIGKYLLIAGAFSFFFYRAVTVFFMAILFTPLYMHLRKRYYLEKRKEELINEFIEALKSIGTNMRAGYSLENACIEAIKDMTLFYGEDCLMVEELKKIQKGLKVNITIEELLEDLGVRSGIKDIEIFSGIVTTAKRNGGLLNEVFENTAARLSDKRSLKQELKVILSEKQYELKIMELIPFMILFYIEMTNRGYFDVLYKGINGRLFMTFSLILYFGAVFLANRIMRFLKYEGAN